MRDQALQHIITELKTRGLQAGAEEGAKLIESAKRKADDIVAEAEARAAQIVEDGAVGRTIGGMIPSVERMAVVVSA